MNWLLRLLVIFAVVWVAARLWRATQQRTLSRRPGAGVESLVRCEHCGVYVPRGEAVSLGDLFFCSAAHRDAGRVQT